MSENALFRKLLLKATVLITIALSSNSCDYNFPDDSQNSPQRYTHNAINRNKNSLHFFVLSDWGYNGSENQRLVAKAMAKQARIVGLNFIVSAGDNFQYNGVSSSSDSLWYYNYENVYSDSFLSVNWYPVLGNHDYYGNPDAEIEYSSINQKWNLPARYYTFVKEIDSTSAIRFIMLDTEGLVQSYNQLSDKEDLSVLNQYIWLKNTLTTTTEKWLIVIGHYPVFSSGLHSDTPELKILLKPLLDEFKVDLYMCGHDHQFEHARVTKLPTDYFIIGTGGDPRPIGILSPNSLFSLSALGFTYISAYNDCLKLSFITNDNKVAYYYEKVKRINTRH